MNARGYFALSINLYIDVQVLMNIIRETAQHPDPQTVTTSCIVGKCFGEKKHLYDRYGARKRFEIQSEMVRESRESRPTRAVALIGWRALQAFTAKNQ